MSTEIIKPKSDRIMYKTIMLGVITGIPQYGEFADTTKQWSRFFNSSGFSIRYWISHII